MNLANYFETGSVIKTLRKRHPYDFAETYELLRQLYGYQKFYVNLGYWKDGLSTKEAGYELVRFLAEKLELTRQSTLIDAGSGMGQAAVDLSHDYELRKVTGININERQIKFANDLRDRDGMSDIIEHICGDASEVPHQLAPHSYDFGIAVECISHFSSAERFFAGMNAALTENGRLVFCLNVAQKVPSLIERWTMKIAYGFVPLSRATWTSRIEAAGFRISDHGDITEHVLIPAMERSIRELGLSSPATDRLSAMRKWFMRRGCQAVLRGATRKSMSYEYFVIEKNR